MIILASNHFSIGTISHNEICESKHGRSSKTNLLLSGHLSHVSKCERERWHLPERAIATETELRIMSLLLYTIQDTSSKRAQCLPLLSRTKVRLRNPIRCGRQACLLTRHRNREYCTRLGKRMRLQKWCPGEVRNVHYGRLPTKLNLNVS